MRWRRLLLVLLAAALVAAGCGGGEGAVATGSTTTTPGTTAAMTTTAGADTTEGETTTSPVVDPQTLAALVAASLLASGEGSLPLDEPSAQCVGEGVVGVLGVDRLRELGLASEGSDAAAVFEQLTEDELAAVLPVVLDCINVGGLIVEALTIAGISASSAGCVADTFANGPGLEELIAAVLSAAEAEEPDAAVVEDLLTVVMGCLTSEEIEGLGGMDLGG